MAKLGDIAQKVRSKNAGPFWLTVDVFCGTKPAFDKVRTGLTNDRVARLFHTSADQIKRFEIPDLNVVKISLPRPVTQGDIADRDLHGASWAALFSDIDIQTRAPSVARPGPTG